MMAMIAADNLTDAPPYMALPFALLLAAIAIAPFVDHHWWERHYAKVSVALGAVTAGYYLFWLGNYARLGHIAHEYASFIALIGSLYVVTGGIHLRVKGASTPARNCLFLAVGALASNVVGTTGASMLLIRPFLHLNRGRLATFHVVFFIFIVSNIAGCLTPIGDPPLFLGYLKGVPFWWVLEHCWRPWLIAVGAVLAVFYGFDRVNFRRLRGLEAAVETAGWKCDGLHNVAFLAVILAAVFVGEPAGLREIIMAAAAVGSRLTTPRGVYAANDFSFAPIKEVAWLFIGIFMTMAPLLDYLTHHASTLGVHTETQLYWFTGLLSGVLDNAPTYVAFLAAALGASGLSAEHPADVAAFVASSGSQVLAISLGAVFFGAMTYIGNGPNFMVKAIAQASGVKTPNFFAYILRYSLPVLGPVFLGVWVLFFSRWRVF